MTTLFVTLRGGGAREVPTEPGLSLMETIRRSGITEITAICGGTCSCGTCHIYVDPAELALLSGPNADEVDMLSFLDNARENSRLACQIRLGPSAPDLHLKIAPEE